MIKLWRMSLKRLIACAFALAWLGGAGAQAKPKKPRPSAGTVNKNEEKPPPPGDQRSNEGATGRKNATEDVAKQAESPTWERRP